MDLYRFLFQWVSALIRPAPPPSLEKMSLCNSNADVTRNPLMIQFFTWDSHHDELSWWEHFRDQIPHLADLGFTQVWLPPPNKAMSKTGRGYDAYDLWDLGEFDQKGSVGTRWGTKAELLHACSVAKDHGIGILIDAVLGHKLGGDRLEDFVAIPVKSENRLVRTGPPRDIEGWTIFDFPGRGSQYSSMKWSYRHFTGIDWDHKTRASTIYYIEGPGRKNWSKHVDKELGNYDYLLGCDIDHSQPDVKIDLLNWGSWILEATGAMGFRLDAIKHMDRRFVSEFLSEARSRSKQPGLFAVSEYWSADITLIEKNIKFFEGQTAFFDVPLHHHLHHASKDVNYDLRTILNMTLLHRRPGDAVTFVDNHDTQIGQSLESWVDSSFKLQAYALILLRGQGYPCVFYGDLYPNHECYEPDTARQLEILSRARKDHAYGTTTDYFSYRNCIGFVRSGDSKSEGCVVVIRSGAESSSHHDAHKDYGKELRVNVQKRFTCQTMYRNLLGQEGHVTVSPEGWGAFPCDLSHVAVWIPVNIDAT